MILGPIAVVTGLLLVFGAIKNPSGFFSNWYEDYRDSKLGFWAISRSANQFRFWHAVLGLGMTVAGVAVVINGL